MRRRLRWAVVSIVLIASWTTVGDGAAMAAEDSLPRVLLIGDSICGGYCKRVKAQLVGEAVVVKPRDNAQHTFNGVEKLDKWLGDGDWNVIHFNWGLWDLAYRNPQSKNFGHLDKVDGKLTTSLEDYEKNLRTLVKRLNATGATLIWASTTPVPAGEPGRIEGDAKRYNAVAAKIMKAEGVAVNDLHAAAVAKGLPNNNNVHTLPDLSPNVVAAIRAALREGRPAHGTDSQR